MRYTGVRAFMCGGWPVVAMTVLMSALLTSKPSSACPAGHRVRLFPLGTVNQEIIVAEIDEHRIIFGHHDEAPFADENLYWVGSLRLRYVTTAGHTRPKWFSLGQTVSRVIYDYIDTRRTLARALSRAETLPGFLPFPAPELIPCAADGRCGPARIVPRGSQVWLELGTARSLLLPAARVVFMMKAVAAYDAADDKNPLSPSRYATRIKPAYLLSHRWGARRVFVTPLSGGVSNNAFAPVGWHRRYCRSVQSCIPPASMYGHEVLMDALVVLPDPGVDGPDHRLKNP